MLISMATHITCDFPGGSGPPIPPLDPHMKCKLSPSVLCDSCSMQVETIVNLYLQCWYIQDLWSKIQEKLTSNNIEFQLS